MRRAPQRLAMYVTAEGAGRRRPQYALTSDLAQTQLRASFLFSSRSQSEHLAHWQKPFPGSPPRCQPCADYAQLRRDASPDPRFRRAKRLNEVRFRLQRARPVLHESRPPAASSPQLRFLPDRPQPSRRAAGQLPPWVLWPRPRSHFSLGFVSCPRTPFVHRQPSEACRRLRFETKLRNPADALSNARTSTGRASRESPNS